MSHQQTTAHVDSITPLTETILQLILTPETYIDYQAGQYLQILSKKNAYCYSIANAPLGLKKYELHIRQDRTNSSTQTLLDKIKQEHTAQICLPFGNCDISHLQKNKPILFIAGGTGFAPIKAMIEQLLATGETRPFELFWGARSQSDLYMDNLVRLWQQRVSHFQYFSQLSTNNQATLGSNVLTRHQTDLKDWQVVIAGPFDMAYSTRDELVAHGALEANIFSDAFTVP